MAELIPPGEAMRILGVRHRMTLARIRKQNPEIAVRPPGMVHWRYLRRRVVELVKIIKEC